jgi:hypothetical protein
VLLLTVSLFTNVQILLGPGVIENNLKDESKTKMELPAHWLLPALRGCKSQILAFYISNSVRPHCHRILSPHTEALKPTTDRLTDIDFCRTDNRKLSCQSLRHYFYLQATQFDSVGEGLKNGIICSYCRVVIQPRSDIPPITRLLEGSPNSFSRNLTSATVR